MKALSFVVTFLSALSMASASDVFLYEMSCTAALKGNPSLGQPSVRTKLNMTFCGMDLSGQLVNDKLEPAGFWSDEQYATCPDAETVGLAYSATRSDGSTYSGFIPANDAKPTGDGEDGREFVMGDCDGQTCEGESAYFRLSTVAEVTFSSIELVRQGKNGPLFYEFENAICQRTDVMEKQIERQLKDEGGMPQDQDSLMILE